MRGKHGLEPPKSTYWQEHATELELLLQENEIDPKVREAVRELNATGFVTLGSCQGHGGERGFVTFVKELPPEALPEIRDILKAHGMRDIQVLSPRPLQPYWSVSFEV